MSQFTSRITFLIFILKSIHVKNKRRLYAKMLSINKIIQVCSATAFNMTGKHNAKKTRARACPASHRLCPWASLLTNLVPVCLLLDLDQKRHGSLFWGYNSRQTDSTNKVRRIVQQLFLSPMKRCTDKNTWLLPASPCTPRWVRDQTLADAAPESLRCTHSSAARKQASQLWFSSFLTWLLQKSLMSPLPQPHLALNLSGWSFNMEPWSCCLLGIIRSTPPALHTPYVSSHSSHPSSLCQAWCCQATALWLRQEVLPHQVCEVRYPG